MDLPAPPAIHILAVEVEDVATFSEHLTPALAARYPALADEIFAEVRRLLAAPAPAFVAAPLAARDRAMAVAAP
jgi:hypothetical protein